MADAPSDAVLSVPGAMFAPDHQRAAADITRVTHPGGAVGLASGTPGGFIGEMFRIITRHVPGPPEVASPILLGTGQHLSDLADRAVAAARSVQRTCTFRFTSAGEFVWFSRHWYGPARRSLRSSTNPAAPPWPPPDRPRPQLGTNRGGSIAIPATYLESILTLR